MKKVIIMRGVPGSGKSTLVDKIKKEIKEKDKSCYVEIFSTDNFFIKDGVYQFDRSKLSLYHKYNFARFCSITGSFTRINERSCVCIVDNTNIKKKEYEKYETLAKWLGWEVEEMIPDGMKLTAEELCARNKHGVPLETIQRMKNDFEWST